MGDSEQPATWIARFSDDTTAEAAAQLLKGPDLEFSEEPLVLANGSVVAAHFDQLSDAWKAERAVEDLTPLSSQSDGDWETIAVSGPEDENGNLEVLQASYGEYIDPESETCLLTISLGDREPVTLSFAEPDPDAGTHIPLGGHRFGFVVRGFSVGLFEDIR